MPSLSFEESGDFKSSREALITRILRFRCGAPIPSDREAAELAEWILECHKAIDQVEPSLRWFQEERKIEQAYFALFLTLWIVASGALLAASTTSLISSTRETSLVITIVSAGVVTMLSFVFGFATRKSMQAQSYRHFQLVLLTSGSKKYRPWGFDWRFKDDDDKGHRRVFFCVYLFIAVIVASSWVFPIIALAKH